MNSCNQWWFHHSAAHVNFKLMHGICDRIYKFTFSMCPFLPLFIFLCFDIKLKVKVNLWWHYGRAPSKGQFRRNSVQIEMCLCVWRPCANTCLLTLLNQRNTRMGKDLSCISTYFNISGQSKNWMVLKKTQWSWKKSTDKWFGKNAMVLKEVNW